MVNSGSLTPLSMPRKHYDKFFWVGICGIIIIGIVVAACLLSDFFSLPDEGCS